ncbi:MAG TPA: cation diffusion facilitator family transporter, partial [Armatimonadota bacterium]
MTPSSPEQSRKIDRIKKGVALLSVVSNTLLVIFKLIVGLSIGSVSVISEAIHSGVDLLAAIIALFAVSTAGKPADEEHPFGHGKVENISGAVEALLIFGAAAWIIYEAFKKLHELKPLDDVGWGVVVMLISALANILVSRQLFRIGKATDSVALQADAWHLRTDVWTSGGVMLGLLIILVGRWLAPGVDLHWVDPVAAIAVALLIIRAAWDLTLQAGRDLLDASLPRHEEDQVREVINLNSPPVLSYHRLRTRKAGATRFIEFHLRVDPGMTVVESHQLSHKIIDEIRERFPDARLTIHTEPF